MRKIGLIPDSNHLNEEYAMKDRSQIDILRIVSAEISDAVIHNKKINDEKAKFIQKSYKIFVSGIVMIAFFVSIFFIR